VNLEYLRKKTQKHHFLPVQSPKKIEEKNSNKVFFGYLYRSKYLIFRPKKFSKNFGAAFVTFGFVEYFGDLVPVLKTKE
jgi:hypothetical protein